MDEWDLTTRDRVKVFKKDMKKRLARVGSDIRTLEKRKSSLDSRMEAVEKGMESLEGL
jgi:chaperonin cofactor prefoldin